MSSRKNNRLSLRIIIDKTKSPEVDSSPNSALIISSKDSNISISKKSYSRSPTTIDSRGNPESFVINLAKIPLKNIENCPLTEVTSFIVTEIQPEQCQKSSNPSVNYFFSRAFSSSQEQEYQQAIVHYKKVLACDSSHFESLINTGVCMVKLGMSKEAISIFSTAIKVNKHSFIPYYNQALTYISLHDYPSALRCMDAASIEISSPPPQLQMIRTYSIFKSGKVSSALSRTEIREKSNSPQLKAREFTPTEEPVFDRTKFNRRTLTMPPAFAIEHNNSMIGKKPEKHGWKVKEFDTREIKADVFPSFIKTPKNPQIEKVNNLKTKRNNGIYNWKKYQPKEFFQAKTLTSRNIEELFEKKEKCGDLALGRKINEKLSSLEDKLVEFLLKSNKQFLSSAMAINQSHLTEEEIIELSALFTEEEKNLDQIDSILRTTDYLSAISEDFRKSIYSIGKIKRAEQGSIVFQHREVVNTFYFLLKGKLISSLDAEISDNSTTEYIQYSRSISLDKYSVLFSDYQATCIAEELSYLLAVKSKDFIGILLDILKYDIEEKVCFLTEIPLFKGLDPLLLIPLAWHAGKEIFTEGEIIQNKNETPKGCMIILKGYCSLNTIGSSQRNDRCFEYANIKKREPKPRPIYTGNISFPIASKQRKITRANSISEGPCFKSNDMIEYGLLRYGDYFGGRLLLDKQICVARSKFSILAESNVEIMIINKTTMQQLPEKLAIHLKTILQRANDPDCPPEVDSSQMDDIFSKWQAYKNDCIDIIQRRNFVDSKKIEFPYLR